jgi:uncharacterized protein
VKKRNKSEKNQREKLNEIYNEFYKAVEDLIEHPVVLEMKNYPHHCDTSCYQHCLNVAYYNFKICKVFGLDAKAAARAGMVHDLFLYDWRLHAELTKDRFHAMTHPKVALNNAKKYFELNELEQEIILKHMWPLTVVPPKSWEAFIIGMTDKYCGFFEILDFYFERHTPNWLHFPFGKIHVK